MRNTSLSHLSPRMAARNQIPKVCHICDSIHAYQSLERVFKVCGIWHMSFMSVTIAQVAADFQSLRSVPPTYLVLFCMNVCRNQPWCPCLDMSQFLNNWMNTAFGSNHIPVFLLSSEANLKPNKQGALQKVGVCENFQAKNAFLHRGATMLRLLRFCFCLPLTFSEELDFEQAPLGLRAAGGCWRPSESKFRRK